MYQHKGESPEPFEQRPIKFVRVFGYGVKTHKEEVQQPPFYFLLIHKT